MRKLISLLLVFMFVISMPYPVFAADYRETALSYLTEKYNVSRDKIEFYEGGTVELEFTAESFWSASYAIYPEGKPVSGSPGEVVKTEPAAMPIPADTTLVAPDVKPVPPVDANNGVIYGGLYIRLKTGEIMEMDKAEPYFAAENKLAEQEWEKLRKEAGKVDVVLYRKLKGVAADEKVKVNIEAVPVESTEINAKLEALKAKYPEITSGMDFSYFYQYGYGSDMAIRGGGASSSSGSTSYAVPEVGAAVTYPAPGSTEPTILPDVNPNDAAVSDAPDERIMEEQSAMWQELDQIRLQALAPSLTAIKKAISDMGVSYQENGSSIGAELVPEQINDIAKLSAVAMVYEDAVYTTMDAARDVASTVAPEAMMAAGPGAEEAAASPSYWLYILAAAVLSAATIVIYRLNKNLAVKK